MGIDTVVGECMEQPAPKLLLATGNPGKARELAELLKGVPFEMVSLRDLKLPTEIDEHADTFEGNAIIKAEAYARMSGLLTLADDSGLQIDALNVQRGVHSKRFACEDYTDSSTVQIVPEFSFGLVQGRAANRDVLTELHHQCKSRFFNRLAA